MVVRIVYRDCESSTCVFVFFSPESSILLDCGKGTYNQLVRFYGDKINEKLQHIKTIFISHMHGDHHLVSPSSKTQRISFYITKHTVILLLLILAYTCCLGFGEAAC